MPKAAAKPCGVCGVAVRDGTSRCAKHPREAWVQTKPYKRESGRRLQAKRTALFEREPLCRECAKHGLVTMATIRDHIKNLGEGGTDDDDNVQPLCGPCHDVKTAEEARRGVGRPGVGMGPGSWGGGQKSSP
jgi:5-methylcytosine-specific restriction protein A